MIVDVNWHIPMWTIYIGIPIAGFIIATVLANTVDDMRFDIFTPILALAIFFMSIVFTIGLYVGRTI